MLVFVVSLNNANSKRYDLKINQHTMKRSVSMSSQAGVAGASSKRNASCPKKTAALPPLSESPAEQDEYEQELREKSTPFCYPSFSSIRSIAKLRSWIGESISDLAKMLNAPKLTIRAHCDSIRQQVDVFLRGTRSSGSWLTSGMWWRWVDVSESRRLASGQWASSTCRRRAMRAATTNSFWSRSTLSWRLDRSCTALHWKLSLK